MKDYKVAANIGNPQVSYKEAITKEVKYHEVFEKTLAGKENRADITFKIEPDKRGTGNSFHSEVPNNKLPKEVQEAVKQGMLNAMQSGTLMGYPLIDVKTTLLDAVYDELASTKLAFETAASLGFDNACREAAPTLMEPIMHLDVMCPADYVGDVISSITQRGGLVNSMESKPSFELVKAQAPLSKLFGYSTTLRSQTQGRGTFSMEFSHFDVK
jgi:elongation factor G